ncbi:MAG: hypothetical protein FWH21_04225 [Kiritimatiellaeota bacterium]|nr:hypothetical protein [Kiritimatiellota bacterium]
MCEHRVSTLAVAGAAVLLALPGRVSGSRFSMGYEWEQDISIRQLSFVKTEGSDTRYHGVAVCTLSVSNRSPVIQTVRLSSYVSSYSIYGNNRIPRYSQECTVKPGASAHVCFKFLPNEEGNNSSRLHVEIAGTPKGVFALDPFPWMVGYASEFSIMLSPSISKTAVEYRDRTLSGANATHFAWGKNVSFLEGKIPVREWPSQWLAYTPADCIVLTREEWTTVPETVRAALLGWLQAGGRLLLAGVHADELERYRIPVGFGDVCAISSAVPEEWTTTDFTVLHAASTQSAAQWKRIIRNSGQGYPTDIAFSLPPLVPVYVVLLGIMLLLGPGLLILLALRNLRIYLYWIAPSVAGGVSVIILVFALVRDGISPITCAQSVVYLNETSRTQVQLAALTLMAPAGLYSPLHFPASAEVMPAPSNLNFATGVRTVRNEGDLILNSAWVPSRIPITFLVRDTGGLTIPTPQFNGTATVANPYAIPIQRLLYCDAEGKHFALDAPLPPGATASLTPCTPAAKGQTPNIVDAVKGTFYNAETFDNIGFSFLSARLQFPLPPKTYLCELDGTPFMEHPIRRGKTRHEGKTLVLGEM